MYMSEWESNPGCLFHITEAKLYFDLTGFEPRTSGSAILTTRPQSL